MILQELNFDSKLTRLEQRVIDVLIERLVLERKVYKVDNLKKLASRDSVSFTEPVDYEKLLPEYQRYEPRVVPYFTRALEPINHYLIPAMNRLDYSIVATHSPQFKSVNVYDSKHTEISSVSHQKLNVALSVACILALYPNLDHNTYSVISEMIKK